MTPGVDFRKDIDHYIGDCDFLIAVIGRGWLTAADKQGNRRIDNSGDFVRVEISAALKRDIPIIPVLVNNQAIPTADELPDELKDLAFRQAVAVRPDPDFEHDVDRLVGAIKHLKSASLADHRPSRLKAKLTNLKNRAAQLSNQLPVAFAALCAVVAIGLLGSWVSGSRLLRTDSDNTTATTINGSPPVPTVPEPQLTEESPLSQAKVPSSLSELPPEAVPIEGNLPSPPQPKLDLSVLNKFPGLDKRAIRN